MTRGKSFVTIKGTKDGLTFLLDDRCSFDELIKELSRQTIGQLQTLQKWRRRTAGLR